MSARNGARLGPSGTDATVRARPPGRTLALVNSHGGPARPAGHKRPVVFLGPSLAVCEAAAILDADYRPPVKRGDIVALLSAPPPAIGIIDGEFFQNLAISPKEVLRAIEADIPVWGASSMGALRAAELHEFGMTGVGAVFELYRSGRVKADDEVAVAFAPGGRLTSEAMINMRIALGSACGEGIIDRGTCRRLLRDVKSMYFPERSWSNLWKKSANWLPRNGANALRRYLARNVPNVKRDDAIRLLHELGAALAGRRVQGSREGFHEL